MKKLTLVATAVMGLLSASAAMAQSTVTVYGLLDAGFNHVSGLKNGSFNGIASGIMEGSRFGLRGTEDLGGGYKAIFTLENRLELDTGSVTNRPNSPIGQLPDRVSATVLANLPGVIPAPVANGTVTAINNAIGANAFGVNLAGNLFDRQAFAGLITPIGAFTLGRQYTPAYLTGAAFDASQTQSSLAAGQVASLPAAFDIRLSNTLQYGIQTGGLTATLMYGAAETSASNPTGRFLGGMAMYKGNGFSVGFGHNEKKNENGQKSLTNNVLGATIDLGPGTVYGHYATIKDDNPTGLTPFFVTAGPVFQNAYNIAFRQDAKLMHIGYRVTTGPHTIVVAFNRLDDKRPVNADTDSYGATYTYALSKRTNLNAVLTRFNNKGTGQAAPGGNGFLGGVTSAAGVGSTNLALGIRHSF
ncbi:Outer membrane protein (porin) [Polaromonas sp. OV174]|uniref:porin n=1 Tax=Polaromonas sp. OV174 TaxID=1855300 RepID=UPI0008EBEEDA|nr:porin [Polaromonas sp. OV174]SFC00597.1 Outer membrane protein (porin) [Polaromonas sp. OV174]